MKHKRLIGLLTLVKICVASLGAANNTIDIPLRMSVFQYKPADSPTRSTPDPTDPNQFRATLTGNTLTIHTQENAVSYVVIRETASEQKNQDYFFGFSYGSITCPISRAGYYRIEIGCWDTDFIGQITIPELGIYNTAGRLVASDTNSLSTLPAGIYIIRLATSLGNTTVKIRTCP